MSEELGITESEQYPAKEDSFALHSPIQEHHIDFLLEEEFASNPSFLSFFVNAASNRASADPSVPKPILPEPGDQGCQHAIRSVTTNAGESDVLVIYKSKTNGSRVAILIEDKIRAAFQSEQAERYRERGNSGIGEHWEHFWTCLVAPDRYSKGLAGFDARVSLEDLMRFFETANDQRSQFKARVVRHAIEAFEASGTRIVDQAMTAFRKFYAEEAETHFSNFQWDITWDRPRNAWYGDSWFVFKSKELPRGVGVIHKTALGKNAYGAVHLYFENTLQPALATALENCENPHNLHAVQTSKSSAIEVRVTPISDFSDPSASKTAISVAFLGVETLMDFWMRNRRLIELELKIETRS